MSVRYPQLIVMVLLGAAAVGCTSPQRREFVSTRKVSIPDPSKSADQLWEAIQETLRRHRFRLDRVDRRAGVITTMPETSEHFFEFWRHDVATWYDLWEANLNPIRRWVEISVARERNQTWQALSVVVHKERLSSPDRQFNSTGAAYQYFGNNLPSTTGLIRVTEEDNRWLDLGRDPAMEDHLLGVILARTGIETTKRPQVAAPEH